MAYEWPIRELKDVARELTVGFVGTMADQYTDSGVLFLRSLNILPFGLDTSEVKFIGADFHAKIRKSALQAGDVVIVRTGRPGTCAVIPEGMGELNCSDLVIVRCGSELRPHFLCYWVNAMAGHHVYAHAVGAVQQHFNVGSAKLIRLPVPSLPEQDRVLGVLRAIDNRIDNLRQTNVTLEAIAQALFKSWFVDFDPVRAKAEGRDMQGMDAVTAALFPSEFEVSELGLIPKGWRPTRVGDVVTTIKGRSYKSSELNDSDVALVTLKSFQRGGGFRRDGFKPYTGTYKNEQVVQEGECIVAFTDVTQQAELIGRTAIVTGSQQCGRLVASLDVGILRPNKASLTPAFLRALLSGERYVAHIKGYTTGTTVLHLAKAGLPSYLFVMPPDELIASWQGIGGACIERQALNVRKIDVLTDLRETLLPRLISGKLRLPEAQASVEEVLA